jgi:hypothetical protein
MVSIIYDKFEMNIANKIVSYMIHPTAEALSEHFELQDLLCFDTDHNWFDWNSIMNHEEHGYIIYLSHIIYFVFVLNKKLYRFYIIFKCQSVIRILKHIT